MIIDWDPTNFYISADNNGDFPTPVTLLMTYALETLIQQNPQDPNNYWYMRLLTDVKTAWGNLPRVLVWIFLDSAYPPNSVNSSLGLNPSTVPYGVTGYTYYAPGLGELRNIDVHAGSWSHRGGIF